ncbi:MAG: LptA/OstA family protein [Candidatus Margulisiibacteriota bacterium]
MKIGYRLILFLFAAFILGIFAWAIFAPKEEISTRIYKTLKEQEKVADLSFKDVTFEEVLAGTRYWQLKAKNAMVNKSTNVATLKDVKGIFYKNGKAVLHFLSPAALWDMQKKEIYLDKPIGYDSSLEKKIASMRKKDKSTVSVFTLPRLYKGGVGAWFEARNLSWKLDDKKMLCTGGIILNKGEATGYADKLQGDVALEKVLLEGNPRIEIASPHSGPITVEAKILEVITPQDLIKFIGNVRINYKDSQAQSDNASYMTRTEKIELEGNASARQEENIITGKRLTVGVKDGKIAVAGKGKVVISEEKLNGAKD